MTPNPHLAAWAAIVAQPVIGRVGHRRTHEAGPCHPQGQSPAWVTAKGASLAKLHRAFCATVTHDRRGEARECGAGPVRRPPRCVARPGVHVVPMQERKRA